MSHSSGSPRIPSKTTVQTIIVYAYGRNALVLFQKLSGPCDSTIKKFWLFAFKKKTLGFDTMNDFLLQPFHHPGGCDSTYIGVGSERNKILPLKKLWAPLYVLERHLSPKNYFEAYTSFKQLRGVNSSYQMPVSSFLKANSHHSFIESHYVLSVPTWWTLGFYSSQHWISIKTTHNQFYGTISCCL